MTARRERGFTLLEVVIATGIVALLTSLALAGYSSQLLKARRQDAQNALFSIATSEAQFYMNNQPNPAARTYTTDISQLGLPFAIAGGTVTSKEGHYNLTVTACADAPITSCFLATAVARPGDPQTRDTTCGTLSIDSRRRRTPDLTDCW